MKVIKLLWQRNALMIVCGQHEHMIHEHQLEVDFCIVVPVSHQISLSHYSDIWITLFLIHEVVKKTTDSQVIQTYLISTFFKKRKQV